MEGELLPDQKRPPTPVPGTPKDGITTDLRQPKTCGGKYRRVFYFMIASALLGLVLWIRHGEAFIAAILSVEAFLSASSKGDHDLHLDPDHLIAIPRGVTLLKCTDWDGQDDLPPSSDSSYPLSLDSLSSLFPPGYPSDVNRGQCDPHFNEFLPDKDQGKIGRGGAELRMRRLTSSAHFTFPLNRTENDKQNRFLFISRGWWSAGRVNVFQRGVKSHQEATSKAKSTIPTIRDGEGEVKVNVEIGYIHKEYLVYTKVCKISVNTAKEGEEAKSSTGIGIFTPDVHRGPHDYAEPFYLTIEFPETSPSRDAKSQPTTITEFVSDMPLFSQNLGDLRSVYFEKLVVASVNQPLKSVSVWGGTLIFRTINAAVFGTFKALKAIRLSTKNAAIEVDIELVQTADALNSTIADLVTANGRIIANATLTSTSEGGTGGNFTVELATNKAAITLAFPSAPINHTLYLGASTWLSPIKVDLPPTYEGSFSLKTALASAALNAKRNTEGDPEGKGRRRELEALQRGYGKIEGATWWGEGRKWDSGGHVKVGTTLSRINLAL